MTNEAATAGQNLTTDLQARADALLPFLDEGVFTPEVGYRIPDMEMEMAAELIRDLFAEIDRLTTLPNEGKTE